jgi:hypothetical protein
MVHRSAPGSKRSRGGATAAVVAMALLGLLALAAYLYGVHWERRLEAKLAEYRAAGQAVTWEGIVARRRTVAGEQTSAAGLLRAFGPLPLNGAHATPRR